jgi:hypothetical protein
MYSSTRSSFACVGFRGYAGGFAAIDVIEDRDRASTGDEGDAISAMERQASTSPQSGMDIAQAGWCGMLLLVSVSVIQQIIRCVAWLSDCG